MMTKPWRYYLTPLMERVIAQYQKQYKTNRYGAVTIIMQHLDMVKRNTP